MGDTRSNFWRANGFLTIPKWHKTLVPGSAISRFVNRHKNDPPICSTTFLHQTAKSHEAVQGSVPWTPPEKSKRHVLERLPHSSGPSTAKTAKDGPSGLTCTAEMWEM